MQLLRLQGRKINDRLLRQGKVWKGKHMVIRWMQGHPRHPNVDLSRQALYAGTIASTKLDKSAVKRNRMRRRCREALRLTLKGVPEIPATFTAVQLLLAPRSSSLWTPFPELQADIQAFLRLHGIRSEKTE